MLSRLKNNVLFVNACLLCAPPPQLKTIKRELGMETDEKTTLLDKFRKNLVGKAVPDDVAKVIDDEMNKLSSTGKESCEKKN